MDLQQLRLSQQEITDLAELSQMRQWTALLKLFRSLEVTATEQLIGFQDQFDAYERRGYIKGLRLGVEVVTQLYAETRNHGGEERRSDSGTGSEPARSAEPGRISESNFAGSITVPTNPADEQPAGWQY